MRLLWTLDTPPTEWVASVIDEPGSVSGTLNRVLVDLDPDVGTRTRPTRAAVHCCRRLVCAITDAVRREHRRPMPRTMHVGRLEERILSGRGPKAVCIIPGSGAGSTDWLASG